VAQLYPRALGSLYVVSYDSHLQPSLYQLNFIGLYLILYAEIAPSRKLTLRVGAAQPNTLRTLIITILDIIHRPVFYLKHDVSVTGFYLRLQVEPISWTQ
jgi:hypothetical protein